MKKIVDYSILAIALIIAVVFYFSFDLENILWNKYDRNVISNVDIENNKSKDFTGQIAGEDITIIKTKEDWDDTLNEIDYVTVTPKSIIKTDVYSLAKWVSPYKKKSNGSSGKKLAEVKQSFIDYSSDYTPYYIIELEDGTKILAQINRGIAKEIEKGKSIKLPLGKKIGFSKTAKNLLAAICNENKVSTDYVLYTIDNEWQSKNATKILLEKLAISTIIFFALGVPALIVVDNKFFKDIDDDFYYN